MRTYQAILSWTISKILSNCWSQIQFVTGHHRWSGVKMRLLCHRSHPRTNQSKWYSTFSSTKKKKRTIGKVESSQKYIRHTEKSKNEIYNGDIQKPTQIIEVFTLPHRFLPESGHSGGFRWNKIWQKALPNCHSGDKLFRWN
jgi:hypothetical protein